MGELPQLLQYVKTHTTPTPTTPVKQEVKQEKGGGGARADGCGGRSKGGEDCRETNTC